MSDPLEEEGKQPLDPPLRPVQGHRVAWLRITIVAALAAVLAALAVLIF